MKGFDSRRILVRQATTAARVERLRETEKSLIFVIVGLRLGTQEQRKDGVREVTKIAQCAEITISGSCTQCMR